MAKDLKEQIEIMTHYLNGGEVEVYKNDRWTMGVNPIWDWDTFDYRIKEQKKKVTIEKWLIKDVNSGEHFIMESSAVDLALKDLALDGCKLKLIESYKVEL